MVDLGNYLLVCKVFYTFAAGKFKHIKLYNYDNYSS